MWSFFINQFRTAIIVIVAVVGLGINAYSQLPQESTPEIKVPIGVVTTPFPGANARDVEKLVTDEIEKEIQNLDELDTYSSSSSEGISSITVEFNADADIDDSIRELKDAVDNAKPELPDDGDDPIVTEISFTDTPIVTFSLVGDFTYKELEDMANDVSDELETINGVSEARVIGERPTEMRVYLNRTKLDGYKISLDQVVQAIQSHHLNLPIGEIITDSLSYQVRLEGEFDQAQQIANTPIVNRNGNTIYIKDVAQTQEKLSKESVLSRISLEGERPKQTISITLFKKTGANVIQTVDTAKETIYGLQNSGVIPPEEEGLFIEVTNDNSEFIRDDFNSLSSSALQTVILIFIVLLLALGTKEAFIASLAIPMTFLSTFIIFQLTGNTLNNITLFGLVLGLGLLVDTSIVVMEGIFENIQKKHLSPSDAALITIHTYRWPLISGTMTTVSAFVPMYLMSGITGQFFSYIPTTVTAVLLSSLVISLTISPALAAKLINPKTLDHKPGAIARAREWVLEILNKEYVALLKILLESRFARWVLVGGSVILFMLSVGLVASGLVKTEAFPLADVNFFNITLEAPQGTKLEVTDEAVKEVEAILQQDPLIQNFVTSVGGGSLTADNSEAFGSGGSSANSNTATITVNLVKKEFRDIKSYNITQKYREKLKEITTAKVSIEETRGGPPQGAPIEVRIFGEDFAQAELIANDIEVMVEELGGIQIDNSISLGSGEFVFYPNIQKMNTFGITTRDLASTLRDAVFGKEAADFVRDDKEIKIWVGFDWGDEEKPLSISDIENIEISNQQGQKISIKDLARIELQPSLQSISHREGDRIVTVTAETGDKAAVDITVPLQAKIDAYTLPDGFRLELGGETEDVDQSFADLQNAMTVALLLIALILVLQFNSFVQPFIILCALPLSLIGVLGGFFLLNIKLGIAAFIGVVSLAGIVVNDAIVLIDRINSNRSHGMNINDAIIEAGPARLQPILITSITTVFGILPLTLTDEFWLGLGSAIIFGITFSTLLTLIVMPVLYKMFETKKAPKCCGLSRRLIAFLIDLLTLFIATWALFYGLSFIGIEAHDPLVFQAALFAISALYFIYFDSELGGGQTAGKYATSVITVDKNGNHIHPFEAFLRYVPVFIFFTVVIAEEVIPSIQNMAQGAIWVLCFFFPLIHYQKRSLQDVISGTFVIYKEAHESIQPGSLRFTGKKWRQYLSYILLAALIAITLNVLIKAPFETEDMFDSIATDVITSVQSPKQE